MLWILEKGGVIKYKKLYYYLLEGILVKRNKRVEFFRGLKKINIPKKDHPQGKLKIYLLWDRNYVNKNLNCFYYKNT